MIFSPEITGCWLTDTNITSLQTPSLDNCFELRVPDCLEGHLHIDLTRFGSSANSNRAIFYSLVGTLFFVLVGLLVLIVGNICNFSGTYCLPLFAGTVAAQHRVYRLLPRRIYVKMNMTRMMAPLILVTIMVLIYVGGKSDSVLCTLLTFVVQILDIKFCISGRIIALLRSKCDAGVSSTIQSRSHSNGIQHSGDVCSICRYENYFFPPIFN